MQAPFLLVLTVWAVSTAATRPEASAPRCRRRFSSEGLSSFNGCCHEAIRGVCSTMHRSSGGLGGCHEGRPRLETPTKKHFPASFFLSLINHDYLLFFMFWFICRLGGHRGGSPWQKSGAMTEVWSAEGACKQKCTGAMDDAVR